LFGSAQTKGSLKFVFDHYQDIIIIIIIIISNDTEMKMKKNWFQEKSRFERRSLHMSNVWNSSGRNERFENIFGFFFNFISSKKKRNCLFRRGFKQLYTYFLYNKVQKDTLSLKKVHTIKHFSTVFLSHVIKPLYVENEL
jgi:hypothetical protein